MLRKTAALLSQRYRLRNAKDVKSFDCSEKAFVLLALFPSNVKVCKFLCKY